MLPYPAISLAPGIFSALEDEKSLKFINLGQCEAIRADR